jgi:hypothetical protein
MFATIVIIVAVDVFVKTEITDRSVNYFLKIKTILSNTMPGHLPLRAGSSGLGKPCLVGPSKTMAHLGFYFTGA